MDFIELEAQLTEEPNVTKVVPSVYLELATKSMMHIRSLISPDSSNSVPINQLQCQYIFDKLCETLNSAKECICGPSLQDVPISDRIFQNLAQTAMEVDKLVGYCCDAQWIQAAIIVANAKEHFASLAFKLRLYTQLLQSIFKKKATKMVTKLQNPKWSDDIEDAEFSIIDQKAQEDRKRLLSRLTQVGSSESENLIKRLDIFCIRGLSHPNILPLFCYATCSRYCSLVMELMDEDLDSLMRNRLGPKTSLDPPFELLEAIDIMLQVAEGMKYLHQNKVMHRDLKAGNILVKCDDGHVYAKVADFGVSKTIESRCTDSNQTTDVGTTKWVAPELFSEESHDAGPSVSRESDLSLKYPFKVDIYSFGMVCYQILTGCIPFVNCNNMRDLRKRIKDGLRPDIPERCPEQLSTLIKKCYHPNPAERPSFRKICVELRHLMWSLMLKNLELGDSTAKWSNLPGAEHLVVKQFQELFSQHKYKEAADFAADLPQGILRTPETVAKFQSIPVQPGQTSPVVQYCGTLLRKGKLNVFESLELSRLVVNQKKKNLLEQCLAEDKLECSEELGDLVKTLDNDMALKIYNKMRENAKMVAAVAENGQFDRDLIYSKQGQGSLPHSAVGRGSPLISPLVVDLDQSHQQVPEDVYRKFHEFNLQGIGIKGKKLVEEQVNELKSFSESLKVLPTAAGKSTNR
ncbi:unnamed protein product [Sphagnum compactum]